MNIDYYNLDKLIKVSVKGFVKSTWYKKQKGYKLFGIVLKKDCVKDIFGLIINIKDIQEKYVINDCGVYEKPSITLHFENDYNKTIYYDSYLNALKGAEKYINSKNWID